MGTIIRVWKAGDCACGYVDFRTWVARPGESVRRCPKCGAERLMIEASEMFTAHVPSTAMKRFHPHENTSFGCFVESPEHLRSLQRKYGCEDADLSQGAADHIPSNFDTPAYNARTRSVPEALDAVDDDHLENARDEHLTIDDAAAHLGAA